MPRVSPLAESLLSHRPEGGPLLYTSTTAHRAWSLFSISGPDGVPKRPRGSPWGWGAGGSWAICQIKAAGLGAWAWPGDEQEVGHSGGAWT